MSVVSDLKKKMALAHTLSKFQPPLRGIKYYICKARVILIDST